MPQPSARLRSAISLFARILSAVALATLRILPRMGRIACVLRSRACLAEPAAQALVHPLEDRAQERAAAVHVVGEIMVEMVADGGLDETRRLEAGQAVL